ncbi:MAG: TIGR01459 family HAD-type hydrolase [Proteobacteria bacterium]|nr:TIGR01459 family HAD-type hydrolase [Pseudomonadota bacterium]
MQQLSGMSAVANRYDAYILDLWGVIHDGSHLYPGVKEALVHLRGAGKKIVFLSNAPRRSLKVEKVLNQLGIGRELYDMVLSSGEAGFTWLASAEKPPLGQKYFYIGPEKDLDVLDGLPYTRVLVPDAADFVLNVGFGSEEQNDTGHDHELIQARALNLPMLCLNPDLEVVKISGERFPCAGVLAHAYAKLGGQVVWFGKPFSGVYAQCEAFLRPVGKDRILAVGDSLDTDIPGALRYGLDCVLVTGGILKDRSAKELEALCRQQALMPTYVARNFSW